MHLIPNSYGSAFREANDCHHPAGSPAGGQFCSKGGGKISFTSDVTGAHSGQQDMRLEAKVGGRPAGFVEFTVYGGEVTVGMVEVKPEFRRQGVGLALLTQMMKEVPEGTVYKPSMQTPEGHKLVTAFLARVKPKTEHDVPPTLEPIIRKAAEFEKPEDFDEWLWETHGDTIKAGRDADQYDEPQPSDLARDLWRELGSEFSRFEFWERARRRRGRLFI